MFSPASLECNGCKYQGYPDTFYDNNEKRVCFCKCSHALCKQCIEKFVNCPICDTEIKEVKNFAAQNLLDSYREDPVTVFRRWWSNEGDKEETCFKCCKPCNYLRICLTCYSAKLDYLVVYGEPDKEKPWEKNEKKMRRRRQIEEFQKKCIYTEIDSDEEIDEIDLKIYFHCDFNLYANLACCADCLMEHHPGHLISTIEELNPVIDVFKQSASRIAARFLVADVEKYGGKCKLRKMRMGRICEKLTHFVTNYFRSPDGVLKVPDIHLSRRSRLSKFFDPMPWENLGDVTRDTVDQMINYLEEEIKLVDCQEDCNCTEIWDEMHSLGFGNQVERKFVEVIEALGNEIVKKCPFPEEEFQNMRDKARQLSISKLHMIYTAFCWNYEKKDVCCLFDSSNHKPCICPTCNKPSCLECFKNCKSTKCAFCGTRYEIIPLDYEPVIDQKVLNLVKFYKENCLELLQNWWEAEMSMIAFCLKCASYTEQLEVCVVCELSQKQSVLKTFETSSDPIFHLSNRLKTFPIRWQCADCDKRLVEEWVHKKSGNSDGWKRGCEHLESRVSYYKLKIGDETCGFNAKALMDIPNSEIAVRLATMNLVFIILGAEIEEKIKCQWRKIQLSKAIGILKTKIRRYLMNGNHLDTESSDIHDSIKKLKIEWYDYLAADCSCIDAWNSGNGSSRRMLREFLKSNPHKCRTIGMLDEDNLEDIDLSLF